MSNIINIPFDELLPKKYKQYADYVNTKKMLPHLYDGLLPVQRRILLSLHMIARSSYVKTAQVTGYCLGHYHPHAEASGTAAWAVDNGFADGDGQWGSKMGVESIAAAATRYTKIKLNNNTEKSAFKFINSVPWIESDLDDEPEYLPTPFPFCLICKYETQSIAFGFKTLIPAYDKNDLFKRLEYLIGKRQTEPIIKPIVYGCTVESTNKELKNLLKTGSGKINIKGISQVDKLTHRVTVRGWNPRSSWDAILKKIDKYKKYNLLSKGEIGYVDESSEKNGGTCIVFNVHRQRGVDDTFDKMVEAIEHSLKATISYNIFVTSNEQNIKNVSVDELLLSCYNKYTEAFISYTNDNIKILQNRKNDYDIILKIRPYIKDLINKNLNINDSINYLFTKTNVSKEKITEILDKYKIKKLLSISLDIKHLENGIKELQKLLTDVPQSIYLEYKENLK